MLRTLLTPLLLKHCDRGPMRGNYETIGADTPFTRPRTSAGQGKLPDGVFTWRFFMVFTPLHRALMPRCLRRVRQQACART